MIRNAIQISVIALMICGCGHGAGHDAFAYKDAQVVLGQRIYQIEKGESLVLSRSSWVHPFYSKSRNVVETCVYIQSDPSLLVPGVTLSFPREGVRAFVDIEQRPIYAATSQGKGWLRIMTVLPESIVAEVYFEASIPNAPRFSYKGIDEYTVKPF